MQQVSVRASTRVWLLLLWVLAFLSACKGRGESATSSADRPVSPAVTAIGMTAAVVASGPLPVQVKFGLGAAPVVDATVPVSLVLAAESAQAALHVQVKGDDGLEIVAPSDRQIERLEPGNPQSWQVSVRGSTAGMHLVTVEISTELVAGGPARVFQFPVLVAAR